MNSTALLDTPITDTATKRVTYSAFACGPDNNLNIQVVGLTNGKSAGAAVLASNQKSATAEGSWNADKTALTPSGAESLSDLVICSGAPVTYAIGLGGDGKIYKTGMLPPSGSWQAGGGVVTQTQTFAAGSLAQQLINTNTVFAIASTGAPWVAAYQDYQQQWQVGYALPSSVTDSFKSIGARPDMSDAGTTHAIGLTAAGAAVEIATASGPGDTAAIWTKGHGALGKSTAQMPAFTQLHLVTADSVGTFHVIGLGSDGSVWDIDQFTALATSPDSPAWTGNSTKILAAGSITQPGIDVYYDGSINIVGYSHSALAILATFVSTAWGTSTTAIPTCGSSLNWKIVNNTAYAFATQKCGTFILGLSGVGILYELAYFDGTTWTAGAQTPISG